MDAERIACWENELATAVLSWRWNSGWRLPVMLPVYKDRTDSLQGESMFFSQGVFALGCRFPPGLQIVAGFVSCSLELPLWKIICIVACF
jgi:hypothetical protein